MTDVFDYKLIRTHRRSISIHIRPGGKVIVRAPYLIPVFLINRFVRDKTDWIQKHLSQAKKMSQKKDIRLKEGSELLFLGNTYTLHLGDYAQISIGKNFQFPNFLVFRLKQELTQWYISQAKKIITGRVVYYTKILKTDFKKISFSDTSSKWGSCSVDNALQFNWRLVMAPILVLDYVVVHELVHTRQKNHREGFWKEVAFYKPAYKQYIKWLKVNAHLLHTI